jgi:hypothetical protein
MLPELQAKADHACACKSRQRDSRGGEQRELTAAAEHVVRACNPQRKKKAALSSFLFPPEETTHAPLE